MMMFRFDHHHPRTCFPGDELVLVDDGEFELGANFGRVTFVLGHVQEDGDVARDLRVLSVRIRAHEPARSIRPVEGGA